MNLSNSNDIDWFELVIPEDIASGSYFKVSSLDSGQPGTLKVSLKDKHSDELLYIDEGLYESTALDLSGFLQGSYLMQVSGLQTEYSLEVNIKQNSDNIEIQPDRFEANESITQSELIRLTTGSLVLDELTIHNENDSDWFRFFYPGDSAGISNIAIQFNSGEGDLDLELYNISEDSSSPFLSSAGLTDTELISFEALPESEYAIRVLPTVVFQMSTLYPLIFPTR